MTGAKGGAGKSKAFGKGKCRNDNVFDITKEIKRDEMTTYNEHVIQGRRMKINGVMTQRVIIM